MARTGPQRIPGAVFDLYFGDGRYSGSDMEVNCGVIHTTEGPTLYNYEGGASAPTVTSVPDFKNERLIHHQHFDIDESARALVNKPGGVQTNQANAFQWELVGTCDLATSKKWTARGIDHIYWPEPPDWAVRDVAWLIRWLYDHHSIPLTGRSEWMAYPASYGNSRVRMSFPEWTAFKGWCGHQHVPENDHGDPGSLPFARILAVAKGGAAEEEDMPTAAEIAKAVWDHRENNPVEGGAPVRMGAVQRYMDYVHGKQTAAIEAVPAAELTPEQITSVAAQVAASPTLAEQIAELVATKLAARLAK